MILLHKQLNGLGARLMFLHDPASGGFIQDLLDKMHKPLLTTLFPRSISLYELFWVLQRPITDSDLSLKADDRC